VSRINLNRIIELEKFVMQAVVHHRRHHLRRVTFATCKIRSSDVADKQRVTGQQLRYAAVPGCFFLVLHENANAFWCMSRRFNKPQLGVAQL
jgi:hypothetical protein